MPLKPKTRGLLSHMRFVAVIVVTVRGTMIFRLMSGNR